MNGSRLEEFLALIYVDSAARAKFRADPVAEARRAGLTETECAALLRMDWTGLDMASRSFARKRSAKEKRAKPSRIRKGWHAILRSLSGDF